MTIRHALRTTGIAPAVVVSGVMCRVCGLQCGDHSGVLQNTSSREEILIVVHAGICRQGSSAPTEARRTDQIQRLSAPWDCSSPSRLCPLSGQPGHHARPLSGGPAVLSAKRLQNGHSTTMWPLCCARLRRIPSSPVL